MIAALASAIWQRGCTELGINRDPLDSTSRNQTTTIRNVSKFTPIPSITISTEGLESPTHDD